MASLLTSFVALALTILSYNLPFYDALQVTYDNRALKINGQRKLIISGSIHYPRSTTQMWPSLIKKAKDGGLNTIETYVFWNAHEPNYREYDFSGNKDLIQFLKAVKNEGLYTMLRIGPHVCAEWNFGGFPVWLYNMPNTTFRTNNAVFMREMGIFTKKIVDMVKGEKLFASQGGNIILAQIENEYGNIISHYGEEGKKYINWCADFALSLNIGVSWIMCQEDDAPKTMINTCNGFYCDQFWPKNNNPKFWTENWSGWFKNWGDGDPHRPAEDLAFAVARFFQYGGSLQNYYMYHGGTNFGRTSGGPYIATTYDYNAPLDEYGNVNQPKWGHLKELHNLLYSLEDVLLYGNATNTDYGRMMSSTVYEYNGKRVCFLGNANDKDDISITFEGKNYITPAWSVTILPDCKTEVYNTARVNAQTTVMVKKLSEGALKWSYRPETIMHLKYGHKNQSSVLIDALDAKQLFDQKVVTNDTTDYLWYMTSFKINENNPILGQELTLEVNTKSHVLHAFFNNKHIGSEWAQDDGKFTFSFERNVKLRKDINTISLLSETVGLPNYGQYFEKVGQGVIGPVKLVEPNGEGMDLSKNTWTYMVGLHGIKKGLFELDDHNKLTWHESDFQTDRMFIWYKTFFKTPAGEDSVVLDLTGMGKGVAWVNGHNIGRYWPSFLAKTDGCPQCDYRGNYGGSKCVTGCGKPSQRWYHVPRSFLRKTGNNQLVLFEEMGGRPQEVRVQTVTVGSIYANVREGNTMELSCQGGGRKISKINFGSFGEPIGSFGSFETSHCDATDTIPVIQSACVGKEKCTLHVSEALFPTTTCKSKTRRLAIEATC
ncbi:PREDICTED: beta-galactosidase 15-like [Ipomoea nil]|uniref:beta-galactosidase 15-like n=1 Tax=Ipomoea nil TaxID=35883 RepID=UPI000900C0B3|nr:PREDICTED: beta-galactosidase 15-like [Ipomoea nil]